jgi:hypothetical protein
VNDNGKQHYHLVSAIVMFRDPASEGIGTLSLNAVIHDPTTKNIPSRMIGKAQQLIQLAFHKKIEDQEVQVMDVFIVGFSYLGNMTPAEFAAAPEGMVKQERVVPGLTN